MLPSPSTRRAWIEMLSWFGVPLITTVALHPEGVDRNHLPSLLMNVVYVALHPEGVDRNLHPSIFCGR